MKKITELPQSMKQMFILFILLLCFFPVNAEKTIEPTNTDSPSEHDSDWDEFGLCSRLSIKEFKSFKGCENYSDEEAEIIIEGLYKLSLISYNAYSNYKNVNIFISK